MKLYVWRHNRKFHSWSMMNEPCVQQALYTDAIAVVAAASAEAALAMLAAANDGWRIDDLRRLEPQEYDLTTPAILFTDVRSE